MPVTPLIERVLSLDWSLRQPGMGLTLDAFTAEEYAGVRMLHHLRDKHQEQQDRRDRMMREARAAQEARQGRFKR